MTYELQMERIPFELRRNQLLIVARGSLTVTFARLLPQHNETLMRVWHQRMNPPWPDQYETSMADRLIPGLESWLP